MLSGESLGKDVGLAFKVKVWDGFSWVVLKSLIDGSSVVMEIMFEDDTSEKDKKYARHYNTTY